MTKLQAATEKEVISRDLYDELYDIKEGYKKLSDEALALTAKLRAQLADAKAQLEAEREVLKRLTMAAECYIHERPVYTGKPIGAEGSPARIEQQRQSDAADELNANIRGVWVVVGEPDLATRQPTQDKE